MLPTTLEELQDRQAALRAALSHGSDMRPGSLVERYRACGKPTCHCAQKGDRGHGPCWSLTHRVSGKTVTKVIPLDAVEATRAQIAEYQRFRALVRELVQISERLCDARLAEGNTAPQESVKKRASQRHSQRRSSRRSTTS